MALENLKSDNDRLYQVAWQRYFAGSTIEKTAEVLGMSQSSVERDWRLARAKLYTELQDAAE